MTENIFSKIFKTGEKAKSWRIFVVIIIITLAAGLIVGGGYYNKGRSKGIKYNKKFGALRDKAILLRS